MWGNVLNKDGGFLGIPRVTSRRILLNKFILLLYFGKKKKKDIKENLPAKITASPHTVLATASLHHEIWQEYCP